MFPKEFAKFNLEKMDGDEKYLVNNHQGALYSPTTITNLRRENKLASLQRKGINPKEADLSNIMTVAERINQSDMEMRRNMNDNSDCLLGIARHVQIIPHVEVHLHTRHLLNFACDLSARGMLVIGIDGTGGLVNLRNTKADGKLQHICISVQLSQCLLDRETSNLFHNKVFTPIIIAERISDKNNASSIESWLSNVIRDASDAMESYPGGAIGHKLRPVLIQMDCALELLNGCISAFRNETQADCAARYNACVIIIVLRYEYLCSTISDNNDEAREEKKMYASIALETINLVSPSVFKQCKAHIYKAISGYPSSKPRNKLPPPMRHWYSQFDQLFGFLAAVNCSPPLCERDYCREWKVQVMQLFIF